MTEANLWLGVRSSSAAMAQEHGRSNVVESETDGRRKLTVFLGTKVLRFHAAKNRRIRLSAAFLFVPKFYRR